MGSIGDFAEEFSTHFRISKLLRRISHVFPRGMHHSCLGHLTCATEKPVFIGKCWRSRGGIIDPLSALESILQNLQRFTNRNCMAHVSVFEITPPKVTFPLGSIGEFAEEYSTHFRLYNSIRPKRPRILLHRCGKRQSMMWSSKIMLGI